MVAFRRVASPIGDTDLLIYDSMLVDRELGRVAAGGTPARRALGATEPPDEAEVRAAERQLRRSLAARGRRAWGWTIFLVLAGPALSLLLLNFAPFIGALFFWLPPLAEFAGTLGGVSGGPLLVAVIAALPAVWCWWRALAKAGEARRWGALARACGSRRYREATLERDTDPALAAFVAEAGPVTARIRSLIRALAERGSDAAGEAAELARQVYLAAARRGLQGTAGVFHALYAELAAAERRLVRLERNDAGLFAERKATREARATRARVRRLFQPYVSSYRGPSSALAPFGGLMGGMMALGVVLLITGLYLVPDDGAVILEPVEARLSSVLPALGLAPESSGSARIERNPGLHWSLPYPFTQRHAVSLGVQRLVLRARFRQASPSTVDVVIVEIRFRIVDVERWARLDADGEGSARLASQLSQILESVIQRSRQDARQAVLQQSPALANDPAQLVARADQLVESRMEEITRVFAAAIGSTDAPRQAGIEVSPTTRFEIVRGVPAAEAGFMGE